MPGQLQWSDMSVDPIAQYVTINHGAWVSSGGLASPIGVYRRKDILLLITNLTEFHTFCDRSELGITSKEDQIYSTRLGNKIGKYEIVSRRNVSNALTQ